MHVAAGHCFLLHALLLHNAVAAGSRMLNPVVALLLFFQLVTVLAVEDPCHRLFSLQEEQLFRIF